jgi:hypothetical protein
MLAQAQLVRRFHFLARKRNRCCLGITPESHCCLAADADPLPFKRRIDLDHPGDLLRIRQCEISHHRSAIGVSYQNEGRLLAELGQSVVQLEIDLRKCARLRPAIAPGISRTVVSANTSELGNAVLHQNPVKRKISKAVLHDNNRIPLARAIHVQLVATQVNQLAGWLRARRRTGRHRVCRA